MQTYKRFSYRDSLILVNILMRNGVGYSVVSATKASSVILKVLAPEGAILVPLFILLMTPYYS